jgi:hypothetical protein
MDALTVCLMMWRGVFDELSRNWATFCAKLIG